MFASRYLRADSFNKVNQFHREKSVSMGLVDTLAFDFLDSRMVQSKIVNRLALKVKSSIGINYYLSRRFAITFDCGFNVGIPQRAYIMDIEIYHPNQAGRPLYKRDKAYFTQNSVDLELGFKYKF